MNHQEIQLTLIREAIEKYIDIKNVQSMEVKNVTEAFEDLLLTMRAECEGAWAVLQEKAATAAILEVDMDKERLAQIRQHSNLKRKLAQSKLENQRLKETLSTANQELQDVQEQYAQYVKGRAKVRVQEKKSKAHMKEVEKESRQLRTEHILLRNAVEKLEEDHDKLKKQLMRKALDCKKKNTMKDNAAGEKSGCTYKCAKKSTATDSPAADT